MTRADDVRVRGLSPAEMRAIDRECARRIRKGERGAGKGARASRAAVCGDWIREAIKRKRPSRRRPR